MAIPDDALGFMAAESDPIIFDAANATTLNGTKLFAVHGIHNDKCTCGMLISECVDKSGKVRAGKHPITDRTSPYPTEKTQRETDGMDKPIGLRPVPWT